MASAIDGLSGLCKWASQMPVLSKVGAQKSLSDGAEYFRRKVNLIKEELDKIGQVRALPCFAQLLRQLRGRQAQLELYALHCHRGLLASRTVPRSPLMLGQGLRNGKPRWLFCRIVWHKA